MAEATVSAPSQPQAPAAGDAEIGDVPEATMYSVKVQLPDGKSVTVDHVSPGDAGIALRQYLADFPESCHYTAYSLEYEVNGRTAVLGDYHEFATIEGLCDGFTFKLRQDRYDIARARQHVRRLRDILNRPPVAAMSAPSADKTEAGETKEEEGKVSENGADQATRNSDATAETSTEVDGKEATEKESGKEKEDEKEEESDEKLLEEIAKTHTQLRAAMLTLPDAAVPVQTPLGAFLDAPNPYSHQEILTQSHDSNQRLPKCVDSITFSGWNPPPPNRRLLGDLVYLEVKILEGHSVFVTSFPGGFFMNSCTATKFNPAPAPNPYYSTTLLQLLQRCSPKFRRAYAELFQVASSKSKFASGAGWDSALLYSLLTNPSTASSSLLGGKPTRAANGIGYAFGRAPWLVKVPEEPEAPKRGGGGKNQDQGKDWTPAELEIVEHSYDLNRAEADLTDAFGMDDRGMLRDWNEEYQASRELPSGSLQERVFRARAMTKVQLDFIEAATEGAKAICSGYIQPLNPLDDQDSQVYVYNNIFFSTSIEYDAMKAREEGGLDSRGPDAPAARSIANHDLLGVRTVARADVPGIHTLLTTVVDYLGKRIVAQSIIPGILQGEHASSHVYGSVDEGETIASQEDVRDRMKLLSSKLYIGERTVKPRGKLLQDEQESKQKNAAEPKSFAGEEPVPLCGPVEMKGIKGSDGRFYILDLVRMTPRDPVYYGHYPKSSEEQVLPVSANVKEDESSKAYSALLRPELVAAFSVYKLQVARRTAALEKLRKRKEEAEKKAASKESSDAEGEEVSTPTEQQQDEEVQVDPLELNVNVWTQYADSLDEEMRSADETKVLEISEYLLTVVLPTLLRDMQTNLVTPLDGDALTLLLHSRGVNVRYLGHLAEKASRHERTGQSPPWVLELLETEMVARAARESFHYFFNKDQTLKDVPAIFAAAFLSCLLGNPEGEDPAFWTEEGLANSSGGRRRQGKSKGRGKGRTPGKALSAADGVVGLLGDEMSEESGVGFTDAGAAAALSKLGLSHEAVWKDVEARIKRKFNYSLQLWCQGGYAKTETQGDGDSVSPQWRLRRTHRVPLSRRFCQKAGLQLFAKEYDYESNSPFLPIDVAGVVPVVKFSMPKRLLRDAADLLDVGRLRLSAGQLQVAYDMVHEALLLLYEVFGGAGTESAQCCSTLSMIVFNAGDYESAVALQRRACVLLERLQGTCHADTVHAHAALSAYLAQYGDTEGAIRHMLRALYLMDLIAGPHHPDSISWYMKLGIIYQEAGYITKAIECFRSALRRPNYDLTQASACLHAIASCHAMLGKFKDAIQHEKKVYTMLKEKLGPDNPNTKQAHEWVRTFTTKAVQFQRMKDRMGAEALPLGSSAAPALKDTHEPTSSAAPAEAKATAQTGDSTGKKKRRRRKNKQ